jgi:hypothetical protein
MRLMYYLCAEEIQLAHLVEKAPVDIHGAFKLSDDINFLYNAEEPPP